MSEMTAVCGSGNLGAYREEVPELGIVKASTKWKDKIASTELCESRLLVKDRADISAALVDDFESIQESRVLLPDEVNGRIFSHTQHAQDIVIIMARVVVSRLGTDRTDGSLKSVIGGYF